MKLEKDGSSFWAEWKNIKNALGDVMHASSN